MDEDNYDKITRKALKMMVIFVVVSLIVLAVIFLLATKAM